MKTTLNRNLKLKIRLEYKEIEEFIELKCIRKTKLSQKWLNLKTQVNIFKRYSKITIKSSRKPTIENR